MGIPDGGILISNDGIINSTNVNSNESTEIVKLFTHASELKNDYLLNLSEVRKDAFRTLYYKAEDILDQQKEIHPISQQSKYILGKMDFSDLGQRRRSNYNLLYQNLFGAKDFNLVFLESDINFSPFYFCIECIESRVDLQKKLASKNIYAPIIWPKSTYLNQICGSNEQFFYENLLCIPCDQRYNSTTMDRIIKILKG